MRKTLVIAALIAGCAGAAPRQSAPPARAIAWLEGDWVGEGPDGERAEEHWAREGEGVLRGRALDEDLRIEPCEDRLCYVAHPRGAAAETSFRGVEIAEGRAVFESPEHDFPQRIEYALQPDGSLTATISDLAGAQRLVWRFRREGDRP